MSTILLPIASLEDYNHLVPFCDSLARKINFTLVISTFGDRDLRMMAQLGSSDKRVEGSEKDFYNVVDSLVNNPEMDISLVCLYPGSVVLDANHNCFHFFSKMRRLTVPYLLLPDLLRHNWTPYNIFFPICNREGEKEASAWAGFWSRHTEGKLRLVHSEIKSTQKQTAIFAILSFTKRLLDKSGVSYELLSFGRTKKQTVDYALEMARNYHNGLLILPAHRLNSPEYIFTGPPEKRILKNRGNTPVLFVNPRRDLYLPCR